MSRCTSYRKSPSAGSVNVRTYGRMCAGCCLLILIGCSQTARRGLEGTVTFDGKPLEAGSIAFMPQPGTKSPTVGGAITQGQFSIEPARGAIPGTFRVEITATRSTGRTLADPRFGKPIDETVQFIPAQYNVDSRLTATVSEQGPNHFEFMLQSK